MHYTHLLLTIMILTSSDTAHAATSIPFTITMNEAVNVTGTPHIAVDVGGVTRYADYASGTGTSSLTFTYDMVAGDVDLDGVTLSSPIDLNGGTITDINGNPETDLTFTVPDTSGIKINYPSLSMDFVADADGRYTLNGTAYNDLPSFLSATGGTYTRNSVGTYFDENGVMQTASANQPRFDHDPVTLQPKGILIEESRTNFLANSTMQGAVIGSPGTAPTFWGFCAGSSGGATCSREVVGLGTDHGLNYIDVRFQGTMPAVSAYYELVIFDNTTNAFNVTNSQTLSSTIHFGLISGVIPASLVYYISEFSGATYLNNRSLKTITSGSVNSTLTPFFSSVGAVNSSVNTLKSPRLVMGSNGTSYNYDFTLRFAALQLEIGAFPTSYIPTSTAAVTRAADDLNIPVGAWYDTTQGTLFSEFDRFGRGSGGYGTAGIVAQFRQQDQDSTEISSSLGTITAAVKFANTFPAYYNVIKPAGTSKGATTYNSVGAYASIDGVSQTGGYGAAIPNFTQLTIGRTNQAGGQNYLNTTASKIKYYPARISDTQLQLLTQ